MKMHRIITAVLAAAAITLLAGCGQDTAAHPLAATSTARTTTASPTTTARRGDITDKDRVFLSQLDAHWTTGIERGQLFEAGESVCSKMRAGQKLEVLRILSHGETQSDGSVNADATSLGQAANFVHAAAVAYCPDQLSGIN